jgi:predicted transcriptional regulator
MTATQQLNFHTAIFAHAKDLTKSDILCYQALGALGSAAECQAWQDEIAAQSTLSNRQTQRSLKKLESVGLISIDRSRRHHLIYRFTHPKAVAEEPVFCRFETTHESSQNDKRGSNTLNTTKGIKNNEKRQLTMMENRNMQNLGTLDIDAQSNLQVLDIRPELTQPFFTAPRLIKSFSPAQILLGHDPEGAIASNLARWSDAWREGVADLVGLQPALIWCKIVEGQEPPLLEGASVTVDVTEVLEAAGEPVSGGEAEPVSGRAGERGGEESSCSGAVRVEEDAGARQGRSVVGGQRSEAERIWERAQALLSGQMTRAMYGQVFGGSRLEAGEGGGYSVVFNSSYSRDWVAHRLENVVRRALESVTGERRLAIEFTTGQSPAGSAEQSWSAGRVAATKSPGF